MSKNKKVAEFILRNNLRSIPPQVILAQFKQSVPDSEKYAVSDVHNALRSIRDGYELPKENEPSPIKTKKNPLKRGSLVEFAHAVSQEGRRFEWEERKTILAVLTQEWS